MVAFFQKIDSRRVSLNWFNRRRNQIIAAVAIILAALAGWFIFSGSSDSSSTSRPTVKIGKSYEIVARLKDRKSTTGRLKLIVTDAQIGDTLLVQGKLARPIKGKKFLIVNMEIESSYKIPLYSFPVDLFRFVRADGQKFAPSTHQGTVEIRPQATKKSNVAFVVSPDDKKFTIEVGEIGKEKETLEITFK